MGRRSRRRDCARSMPAQNMKKTLAAVREFRAGDDATPIVLMGYYNPIYVYGVDRFLADAKAPASTALIVVDLPPEEDAELCLPALQAGLNFIRLATPTTDDKRLPAVLTNTSGFVYYVSITGITGSAAPDPAKLPPRLRASSGIPSFRSASASACARPNRRARIARKCRRRRGRLGAGRRGAQEPRSRRQADGGDGGGGHRSRPRAGRRRARRKPRLRTAAGRLGRARTARR